MQEILIEVEENDLRAIEKVAKEEKRSRRAQISKILADYVEAHK